MTDLNQNTNPTTNNPEDTNTEVGLNNNPNPGENVESTENNLNFAEMFPENPSDTSMETDKNTIFSNTDTNGETLKNPEQNPTQETPELNTPEVTNNLASENLNSTQEPETVNNEIILGKFDNPIINTTEEHIVSTPIDPSLLEHPAILENSPSEEPNTEELQKAKLAQKEKLLQLIKTHESKAQKSGFIKGIFSGVVLTACIAVAGCFFAKDQVVSFLNNLGNQTPLTASIVDLNENLVEEVENTEVDENLVEEVENTEVDENLVEDIENTEVDENLVEEVENTEVDENLVEDIENTEVNENLDEEVENTEVDENLDEDIENTEVDENNNIYNITRVNSEKEANRVLPSHCSDLTCYGENKEFTPCTTFRLSENLDENANRIGKNGVCKYKDPSELVYVEL